MSDIKFNCQFCNQSLEAPLDMAGDLVDCPTCSKTLEIPIPGRPESSPLAEYQPRQRRAPPPRAASPRRGAPAGDVNVVLGVTGSLILVLGVFSPLISVPIMGSMNYFQNGKGDEVLILVLAGASLLLSVARQTRGLWLTPQFVGRLEGGAEA